MTGVTMSRGGAPSSQIGLFSTQISEQIVRLRAISDGRDSEGPQTDAVALKRAVMATRLLAGSARILRLDSLQQFLDQLLVWLQRLESGGQPLTPTESMILESVIDLEESLMDSIDETEDMEVDLSVYDQDFQELLTMMSRHSEPAASPPAAEVPAARPAPPATPGPPAEKTPSPPAKQSSREIALTNALEALIHELEGFRHEQGKHAISPEGRDSLAVLAHRLVDVVDSLAPREEVQRAPATEDLGSLLSETMESAAGEWPRGDDLLDPLWNHLRDQGERMGMQIQFQVNGDSSLIEEGMRGVTGQILKFLLDDVCGRFQQAVYASEELGGFPRVLLEIKRNQGRLEFRLRDNAPSIDNRAALLGEDDLSFYRGLRRSRVLIQQLGGMVRVEPEAAGDLRFTLALPAQAGAQSYQLMNIAGEVVAVPWVAVEGRISVSDVRLETDNSGESFERDGHTVPLVDLSGWVSTPSGNSDSQESIALLGSVERRVGILCETMGEVVEATSLGEPRGNWGLVSLGSLDMEGDWVPVLDVRRILRLRFSTSGNDDLSGAINDPLLDSYVPVEPDTAGPATPSAGPITSLRILLVNQSEFRRRDLARTLEDLGHLVTTAKDLDTAAGHAQPGAYDLVVTDLRLGQQGADRLQAMREAQPEVPIVLTSAVAREQAEELAAKVGASHCWLEPYRSSDLAQILRELA